MNHPEESSLYNSPASSHAKEGAATQQMSLQQSEPNMAVPLTIGAIKQMLELLCDESVSFFFCLFFLF